MNVNIVVKCVHVQKQNSLLEIAKVLRWMVTVMESHVKSSGVIINSNKSKETNQIPAGGFLIAHFRR